MPAQTPTEAWTPGQPLANFREIVFGTYTFPLTIQETSRLSKISLNRLKLPFNAGEWISGNPTMIGRDIDLVGTVGAGMIGSSGNTLVTASDLESEYNQLSGLMGTTNKLFVRPDRYCWAKLTEFNHKPMEGGSFQYADWEVKFVADDPRYYSTNVSTVVSPQITNNTQTQFGVNTDQLGNTLAFPTFTIVGSGTGPTIIIQSGSPYIKVIFSKLTMTNDTLVIKCDPRPEYRQVCAQLTNRGTSALFGIYPPTDLYNNLDARYIFPFMPPSPVNFYTQMQSGSANYKCTVTYNDTWI